MIRRQSAITSRSSGRWCNCLDARSFRATALTTAGNSRVQISELSTSDPSRCRRLISAHQKSRNNDGRQCRFTPASVAKEAAVTERMSGSHTPAKPVRNRRLGFDSIRPIRQPMATAGAADNNIPFTSGQSSCSGSDAREGFCVHSPGQLVASDPIKMPMPSTSPIIAADFHQDFRNPSRATAAQNGTAMPSQGQSLELAADLTEGSPTEIARSHSKYPNASQSINTCNHGFPSPSNRDAKNAGPM